MSEPIPPDRADDAPPPPVDDILLEILRAGPAHNQLLSPLTPYLALCGADGPVGLQLPFEHAQLLTRLDRLRDRADVAHAPEAQRDAEIHELGATVARVLGQVPALVSALQAVRLQAPGRLAGRLVNIRLRVSAHELGLVPFEATLPPADSAGFGGERQPLLLQRQPMTGMTREIRRRQALPVDWNRAPRILFAFASPTGLPPVPAQEHVDALRRAIDPWVGIHPTAEERLVDVRRMLTVLKNASVRTIAAACRSGDYSHVHLLAHGAPLPGSDGLRRFGVCLAEDGEDGGGDDGAGREGTGHVVVDGQRLALALAGVGGDGHRSMPPPTVVTLATCDSGNVGSVLAPGGSIAHALHAQDIAWVVASQFPLGMRASTLLTESLYAGLLAGDDPRWVLHRVRQRLRLELPQTHDWASLVAYATIAPDLPAQLDAFRSRQTRARLDVLFARMDALVGSRLETHGTGMASGQSPEHSPDAAGLELARLGSRVRAELAAWCAEPVARADRRQLAARLTMRAASEKRIAIASGAWSAEGADARLRSAEAYRLARRYYRAACKAEPASHWALTQFLSLLVTPALSPTAADLEAATSRHRRWWQTAWQLADWDAASASVGRARAWAHGTLAELELLGAVYAGDESAQAARHDAVVTECRRLCEACDDDPLEDRFPIASTLRQFRRYVENWPRPEWAALARAAVSVLEDGG